MQSEYEKLFFRNGSRVFEPLVIAGRLRKNEGTISLIKTADALLRGRIEEMRAARNTHRYLTYVINVYRNNVFARSSPTCFGFHDVRSRAASLPIRASERALLYVSVVVFCCYIVGEPSAVIVRPPQFTAIAATPIAFPPRHRSVVGRFLERAPIRCPFCPPLFLHGGTDAAQEAHYANYSATRRLVVALILSVRRRPARDELAATSRG